jgi:ketosteroid isomerase-like protein
MTHQNAELLHMAYGAFRNGDLKALLGMLTDDIAWRDSTLGPLAGDYRGKDQVLGLFGKMMEIYGGTLCLDVVDIFANDDRGVVLTQEAGIVAGEPISWTGVHVWSFRDGRCARFVAYADADYQQFWRVRLSGPMGS